MIVIDPKKVSEDHKLFDYHGYWHEANRLRNTYRYKLPQIFNILEGQLACYGFARYTGFQSFRKEYYRYLRRYRDRLK
jgi:hypothetical protein